MLHLSLFVTFVKKRDKILVLIKFTFNEIGMAESSEFVNELFEALVRRRGTTSISKTELFDFWEQIAGDSFDARLQIFFDM